MSFLNWLFPVLLVFSPTTLGNWINHSSIQNGGNFNFMMQYKPNKSRGINKSAFPYSLSTEK